MTKISDIERISIDLLKLKPIEAQKRVYESYRDYLNKYFEIKDNYDTLFSVTPL